MDKDTRILTEVLAASDAVFRPLRTWAAGVPGKVWELRRDFRERGIPWTTAGLSSGGRKATERELTQLQAAGAVTLFVGTRRAGLRLTDKGEGQARAVSGLPGFTDCLAGMRVLDRGGLWTPETVLSSLPVNWQGCDKVEARESLALDELMLLPGLTRGWIEGASDLHGRVCYRLTPAGTEIVTTGKTPKDPKCALDDDAAGLYFEARREAFERLARMERETPGELGYIPLSICEVLQAWDKHNGR